MARTADGELLVLHARELAVLTGKHGRQVGVNAYRFDHDELIRSNEIFFS